MRKFAVYAAALTLLSACNGKNNGELVGVERGAQFYEPDPYGMVFVPQGSFNMGQNEQDVASLTNALTKTVTISSFWMDETEITNSEYRQFVDWVRDSIARTLLGAANEEYLISEDKNGNPLDKPILNWTKELDWTDPENQEVLNEMYLSEGERFFGRKEFDNRKWVYTYDWVDLLQAAKLTNRYDYAEGKYHGVVYDINGERRELEDGNRSAFIMSDKVLVYPDTLCWIENFTYSFNEPIAKLYFNHAGFDTYPVVGISWKQATAFCIWRSNLLNDYLKSEGQPLAMDYRLPTEAEWEYAARGGNQSKGYKYSGSNNIDEVAWYDGNSGDKPCEVALKLPNELGVFDMSGNIWEWCQDGFYEYSSSAQTNPIGALSGSCRVGRGGSWRQDAGNSRSSRRGCGTSSSRYNYHGLRLALDFNHAK